MQSIWQYVGRRRFLNRKLRNFQPEVLEINFSKTESLFVDPKDLYGPSFYVMYGGRAAFYHYEEPVKSALLEHLPQNGIFFDVGANIGLISFFVSKFRKDVEIFSFEPARCTSLAMEKTIEKNSIKNISVIKEGVSDKSQRNVSFFIDSKSSGGNSLLQTAISHEIKESENISLTTIDDFVEKNNKIPSVVKVDVQDAENLVIKGAKKTIDAYHPTFIVETNNELLLKDSSEFLEAFKGYSVYKVGSKKIVPIDQFPNLAKEYLEKGEGVLDYVFFRG